MPLPSSLSPLVTTSLFPVSVSPFVFVIFTSFLPTFKGMCSEVLVRARTRPLAPIQRYSFSAVRPPFSPTPDALKSFPLSFFSPFSFSSEQSCFIFHRIWFSVSALSFLPLSVSLMTFELSQLFYAFSFHIHPYFSPISALKDSCTMSKL